MAANNSEANYPPPVPSSRRSGESAGQTEATDEPDPLAPDQVDLDQIGALMAMNIGLEETPAETTPAENTPQADYPPHPVGSPEPSEWLGLDEPFVGQRQAEPELPTLGPMPEVEPLAVELPTHHQSDHAPSDLPPAVDHAPITTAVPNNTALTHNTALTPQRTPDTGPASPVIAGDGPAAMLFSAFSRSPWIVVGAAVAVLFLVAAMNWIVGGSGDQDSQGGTEVLTTPAPDDGADDIADQSALTPNVPPLSPAAIPPVDQPGLVGFDLDLFDPYTGRGTTGSVELFLNAVTGQICHKFDAEVMTSRYRAYIHEAVYPREGPSIVDLGETMAGVSQCAMASPIELARIMTHGDDFYVAAHSPDREVLLRGQFSAATSVFDNRDEETIAEQAATAEASQTTPTTDADPDALFGGTEEGAYLIVDAGRVTFEGAVSDAATASRLQTAFIPLAGLGVEVVDNLTIDAGAPAPSGRVVVADALLFGSGQDQIEGNPLVLTTLADLLRVNSAWTATITGHTDDVGEWLYNVDLSLRRANNIRTSLAQLSVPAERIRVQGAGPEQPIADNTTPEGRARNRRIEISISSGS